MSGGICPCSRRAALHDGRPVRHGRIPANAGSPHRPGLRPRRLAEADGAAEELRREYGEIVLNAGCESASRRLDSACLDRGLPAGRELLPEPAPDRENHGPPGPVAFAAAPIRGALGGILFAFLALRVAGVIQPAIKTYGRHYEVVADNTAAVPALTPEQATASRSPSSRVPWRRRSRHQVPDGPRPDDR